MRIYTISDAYADMSEEEFLEDLEMFYSQYLRKHRIDDLVEKEVRDVYALYICRYLEYTDKTFDITQN
jgi:hypothetical protein